MTKTASPTKTTTLPDEAPRLHQLNISNYMRIAAGTIRPRPGVTRISGKNGSGKTSTIGSIAAVIGGARFCPDRPIRDGQNKAEVSCDFGPFTVTRTWTRKVDEETGKESVSSSLKAVRKDGTPIKSPQEFLSQLFNPIALNPYSFIDLDPKGQLAALKDAAGLTVKFEELEAERLRLYELRRNANTEVALKNSQLAGCPMVAGPDAEQSAADLTTEYQAGVDQQHANEKERTTLGKADAKVTQIRAEIAQLEEKLADLRKQERNGADWLAENRERIGQLEDPDLDAIRAKMTNLDKANAAARQRAQHRAMVKDLDAASARAQALDAQVKKAEADKEELVKNAKLPVPGLGFTDEGVTLNGRPFSQACTAEQLRAAVAMVAVQQPLLKLMFIHRGESLDDSSMAVLDAIAAEYGFDIWVERVTNGEADGVLIEEGSIIDGGVA